jgi:L-lysine 6-monooxygenase (NADPH-requiring)
MQTEFYRDPATPIDPTSLLTFLNYLKAHQRPDQFFCSEYICPTGKLPTVSLLSGFEHFRDHGGVDSVGSLDPLADKLSGSFF